MESRENPHGSLTIQAADASAGLLGEDDCLHLGFL